MPTLTVIGSRSVASNCRLRSTSSACRFVTTGSSSEATDGEERLVAGPVPVVLVQEPEVVDIDERDREWPAGGARGLGLERESTDDRAVVERPRQGVAAGRLDELRGLSRQAPLGGPEDQEEQRRSDHRRG